MEKDFQIGKVRFYFNSNHKWLYKANQPNHNMVFNPKVNTLQSRILIRLDKALRLFVPYNKSGDNISPRIFVS